MVKYLDYINGEKLPFRVSYFALKRIKEQSKKVMNAENPSNEMGFEQYELLLFYALQRGYELEKQECPFTMEDMEKVLDIVFSQFIKKIPEFFQDEEVLGNLMMGTAPGVPKSKETPVSKPTEETTE